MFIDPIRAEILGAGAFSQILSKLPNDAGTWAKRLPKLAKDKKIVLRPVLGRMTDYAVHLKSIKDWQGQKIKRQLASAIEQVANSDKGGKNVWIVEISCSDL